MLVSLAILVGLGDFVLQLLRACLRVARSGFIIRRFRLVGIRVRAGGRGGKIVKGLFQALAGKLAPFIGGFVLDDRSRGFVANRGGRLEGFQGADRGRQNREDRYGDRHSGEERIAAVGNVLRMLGMFEMLGR